MVTRDYYSFAVGQRPAITVSMGQHWWRGELRSWIRRPDGWWAHIEYVAGRDRHVTTVPAGRIRSDDARAAVPSDDPEPEPGRQDDQQD